MRYGIHLRTISQWVPKALFCILSFRIKLLELLSHLSRANALTIWNHINHTVLVCMDQLWCNLSFVVHNLFKNTKQYIYILFHFSAFRWRCQKESFLVKDNMTRQWWKSISWPLKTWQDKGSVGRCSRCWLSYPGIFWIPRRGDDNDKHINMH